MGTPLIDITGQTLGNWTVLYKGSPQAKGTRWMCRCVKCRTRQLVLAIHLRGLRAQKTCRACKGPPATSASDARRDASGRS